MKKHVRVIVVAVLAVGIVPAAASAARSGHPPRIAGPSNATSTNWSGYAATGSTYHSVSASWTQPAVTCAAGETSYASFWVGLDGYTSRTVEQTGTASDCVNGTPTYYAWYEMYPKLFGRLAIPVSAGDTVSASVTAGPNGSFTLTLSVNGSSQTVTGSNRHAALSSAEVITEAPSSNHGPFGTLGLADFGTVSFSGATVDSAALSAANPTEITMVSGSTVKAQPSALNDGSFSVTWEHA
jgi:hypothetical protein